MPEVNELVDEMFAWTAPGGYYPAYVNLTGNRLTVRGPARDGAIADQYFIEAGPTVTVDLPDEAIAALRQRPDDAPCPDCGVLPMLGNHTLDCPRQRPDAVVEAVVDAVESAIRTLQRAVHEIPGGAPAEQTVLRAIATLSAILSQKDKGRDS